MGDQKYVVFRVANELFGLPIGVVERILPAQRTTRVPHMPPMIIGVFSLRGETIAAVDMRMRFDLEASVRDGSFVVFLSGADRVALKVDGVDGILTFSKSDIDSKCDFLRDKQDDFLAGVARNGEERVVLLEPDNLLPAHVRTQAAALAA